MSRILVLGGTGAFGIRVCELLGRVASKSAISTIIIGSRGQSLAHSPVDLLTRLQSLAPPTGVAYEFLSVDASAADLDKQLTQRKVDVVIHAAGPFQQQSYHVAEACISAGADYIDLADGREFVAGISCLDELAKRANVAVQSGASTTPAVTSAVVADCEHEFARIDCINIGITPGNKSPRGPATMQSILSYVGRPIPWFVNSAHTTVPGWSQLEWRDLTSPRDSSRNLPFRLFSSCDVPDVSMFPRRFNVHQEVTFKAGLELKIMHLGLTALAYPVRWGIFTSLSKLYPFLSWAATRLLPFGTGNGGMFIDVVGLNVARLPHKVQYKVIAKSSHGPYIPALASAILAARAAQERGDAAKRYIGAYPCIALITMAEVRSVSQHLDITWEKQSAIPLYKKIIGEAQFNVLPKAIQNLHSAVHKSVWQGVADVQPATNIVGRLIAWMAKMPSCRGEVPLTFVLTVKDGVEIWERNFGSSRFISTQGLHESIDGGKYLVESFGPLRFAMRLQTNRQGLGLSITHGWFGKLPIPALCWPDIIATERVIDGEFHFFVRIRAPFVGHLVQYSGYLREFSVA